MNVKNGWVVNPFADRNVQQAPAYVGNYYADRVCTPIALCIHEPQEPADGRESTPVWFQNPAAHASTRWYGDNDGDLIQCVPYPAAAIANGLDGKAEPRFNDGGPEFNGRSLNNLTDNIEVEGYTHTIHQTFTEAQYQGLCDWLVMGYLHWNLPRNPKRVFAHKDVSVDRTDGHWIVYQSGVVQEAVNRVLQIEKDIRELKGYAYRDAQRINGLETNVWTQALRLNDLEKHTVHPPK